MYNERMSDERLNSILRDIIIRAEQVFGDSLTDVILYGSFARGDAKSGSDIDIMLLADIRTDDIRQYKAAVNEIAWELGMQYDILISMSLSATSYFHDWKDDMPFYHNVWTEGRRISA